MKVLAITLLIGIVSLTNGDPINWRPKCNPGETWRDSCNTCFCEADATASCSKEECRGKGIYLPVFSVKEKREVVGGECAPGTYWREKCNSCSCSNDGYKTCTRVKCRDD